MLYIPLWFTTTVALLAVGFTGYLTFSRRVRATLNDFEVSSEAKLQKLISVVEQNLRPKIHVHDSRDNVARRAAEIIRSVAQEVRQFEQESMESDDSEHLSSVQKRPFITFYGAASLSTAADSPNRNQKDTSTQTSNTGISTDHEEKSPAQLYSDAIETASRAKVIMRRYVCLFSPEELTDRSATVKGRYLNWLMTQQYQLANDELYQLIHILRAPKWGANMARILTSSTVMEITGNGAAAVVIEDRTAAATIRDYARQAVLEGENAPKIYGLAAGEGSLREFAEYIGTIREAVS